MKRKMYLLFLSFFCVLLAMAAPGELKEKLQTLSGVNAIETLKTELYPEKYLVRVTQEVDPLGKQAGTFKQRVVLCHIGFDRPTVLVTEGYGGAYALRETYQEELSKLLNANVIFVEYRYFLESKPDPLNWDYLTAENSAYDLHRITELFKQIYTGKWISTGISKGGQATTLYRAYFPDDVDFSVPYVAPLNRGVEDGRHEIFLEKVGTKAERKKIRDFQLEILKNRDELMPLFEAYVKEKGYQFRVPTEEIYDYSVLEYPFALWQWGTSVNTIPALDSDKETLFRHWMEISDPSYFSIGQDTEPFNVQAARELGYYGYDTKPFEKYLSIKSSQGYLNRIMLPDELKDKVEFRPELYQKVYNFLKDNDPKMIFIYGEIDPWSATRVPIFKGKKNEQVYIQPRGSHRARISNMPDDMKEKIMRQINEWLAE